MSLDTEIDEIMKHVDVIATAAAEKGLTDEQAKKIESLMQDFDDKLTEILAASGVEIGDERVD